MTLLLLGLLALAAVWRMRGDARADARWLALLALVPMVTLWFARDEVARYRFTLLGLRYDASASETLSAGGDYWEADLYIAGAGDAESLRLEIADDSTERTVLVQPAEDASAVTLIEEDGALRVAGGLPLATGDTIFIGTGIHLTMERTGGLLPRAAVVRDIATGQEATLPLPSRGWVRRVWPARPSVLQRTYPLADVLAVLGIEDVPPLSSFLYYERGRVVLADLDSEVTLSGERVPQAEEVWRDGRGVRILVAGLAHRDSPDPDLTPPERYGVRPLRGFAPELRGRWLDLVFATPEIRSLDRASLEALDVAERGRRGSDDVYSVRLTPARNVPTREAVAFETPAQRFAAGSQAVFRLPRNPSASTFHVLTPAGLAAWESGRPFPLGEADRAILMRVDGQATRASSWLLFAVLLGLGAAAPLLPGLRGAVPALSIGAFALAALRLPLGLTAHLGPPFAQEAHQLGLWLLAALPWSVIVCADLARAFGDEALDREPALRRIAHLVYALVLFALALVLFPGSTAKIAVLGLLPAALVTLLFFIGRVHAPLQRAGTRMFDAIRRLLWPGLAIGVSLLVLRVVLALLGWREAVPVGGTRIAVSVLYTPLTMLAVACVAAVHARRVAAAGAQRSRPLARAALDLWLLLGSAFVGVGALISDFGIVLVGMAGALVFVAMLGARWAAPSLHGPIPAGAFALPLLLFVLLQALPGITRPLWQDAVQEADARMAEWGRNELLLLERGDPDALRLIGQRRSEALAVTSETLRSYTRGNLFGRGVLNGRVTDEIRETSVREHTVSALLASQWGLAGVGGLVLVLGAMTLPFAGSAQARRRHGGSRVHITIAVLFPLLLWALPSPLDAVALALAAVPVVAITAGVALGRLKPERFDAVPPVTEPQTRVLGAVSLVALLTLVLAGAYMVLANYGLVFFTGKNVYGLGLDSVGDALETITLLGLAVAAPALRRLEVEG